MIIKAIIPCAGFGTRMGMKSHEAKEMLIDPITGKYLIDYSLDLCYKYKIEPIVISRIEKEELNKYLRDKQVEHIVLKTPGKEWAETVLKSQGLWGDKNILLLPDTRFEPHNIIPKIIHDLTSNHTSAGDLIVAVHEINPDDCNKWGTITGSTIYEKCYIKTNLAWGIIGWKNGIGSYLFLALYPESYYDLYDSIIYHKLDSFRDITRTGQLERY